jgi:hypothetical protein
MTDTGVSVESSETAEHGAAEGREQLNQARQGDIAELRTVLQELIRDDESIKETLKQEGLSQEDLLQESMTVTEGQFTEISDRLRQLRSAQEKRDILLRKEDPWYVSLAWILTGLGALGLLVLLGVGLAKWNGHILKWPIWPFVTFPLVLFFGGVLVAAIFEPSASELNSATVAAQRLKSGLNEALRTLVLAPAIERLVSPKLVNPNNDRVLLTDAPSLSSRIESGNRVQTGSYREVFTSLHRDGGATIGLAGIRGVGKSELLGSFCDDPDEQPSIHAGGVIGIVIPAPVAYEAVPFLRVLIRRLAEAVPEYAKHANRRSKLLPGAGLTILLLAALCFAVGLALDPDWMKDSRHSAGLAFLLIAGLLILTWAIRLLVNSSIWRSMIDGISLRSLYPDALQVTFALVSIRFSFPNIKGDSEAAGTQINRRHRSQLSEEAVNVAQRINYVEKRSSSSTHSIGWNNFGFTRGLEIDLDRIPLTEPDLVAELSKFVEALHGGGYEIRIGIDELDKLADGKEAERFLTGIKVLFSIRDCSFLLTVSENAAAQFARRGMPIRDVFDSSLDTVVVVQPLTFYEARRLVRTRLSAGQSDRISDSQVLLCHYLAGGLPRDLLRYCRQLGDLNSRVGGDSTLQDLMGTMLRDEINTRIDAVTFALQSRKREETSATFMAELDRLRDAVEDKKIFEVLDWFLSTDSSFTCLSIDANAEVAGRDISYLKNERKRESWIQDSRRQLYSIVYFIETVRQALEKAETLDPERFDLLAEARRWMELDAAAAWRRTTRVGLLFELTLPARILEAAQARKAALAPGAVPASSYDPADRVPDGQDAAQHATTAEQPPGLRNPRRGQDEPDDRGEQQEV